MILSRQDVKSITPVVINNRSLGRKYLPVGEARRREDLGHRDLGQGVGDLGQGREGEGPGLEIEVEVVVINTAYLQSCLVLEVAVRGVSRGNLRMSNLKSMAIRQWKIRWKVPLWTRNSGRSGSE